MKLYTLKLSLLLLLLFCRTTSSQDNTQIGNHVLEEPTNIPGGNWGMPDNALVGMRPKTVPDSNWNWELPSNSPIEMRPGIIPESNWNWSLTQPRSSILTSENITKTSLVVSNRFIGVINTTKHILHFAPDDLAVISLLPQEIRTIPVDSGVNLTGKINSNDSMIDFSLKAGKIYKLHSLGDKWQFSELN